jgi:hypothetical protein
VALVKARHLMELFIMAKAVLVEAVELLVMMAQ